MLLEYTRELKDVERSKRYSSITVNQIQNIVQYFAYEIKYVLKSGVAVADSLRDSLGTFLCKLFTMFDRGVVIDMVQNVLDIWSPTIKNEQDYTTPSRLAFISTIFKYKHFIALNMPHNIEITAEVLSNMDTTFGKHYLIYNTCKIIMSVLKEGDSYIKQIASEILVELIDNFDKDSRYQSKSCKKAFAEMFFPFILDIIENRSTIAEMAFPIKRNVYCALLYFDQYNRKQMTSWLEIAENDKAFGYCELLSEMIDVFKIKGEKKLCELMDAGKKLANKSKALIENMIQYEIFLIY